LVVQAFDREEEIPCGERLHRKFVGVKKKKKKDVHGCGGAGERAWGLKVAFGAGGELASGGWPLK